MFTPTLAKFLKQWACSSTVRKSSQDETSRKLRNWTEQCKMAALCLQTVDSFSPANINCSYDGTSCINPFPFPSLAGNSMWPHPPKHHHHISALSYLTLEDAPPTCSGTSNLKKIPAIVRAWTTGLFQKNASINYAGILRQINCRHTLGLTEYFKKP